MHVYCAPKRPYDNTLKTGCRHLDIITHMDRRAAHSKKAISPRGPFKRANTCLEEEKRTRRRTMWNGCTMVQKCDPNTCAVVQCARTPVEKAALSPLREKNKLQVVRRLLCMNNSRSFEDGLDEGPRERLLVGDGPRQRLSSGLTRPCEAAASPSWFFPSLRQPRGFTPRVGRAPPGSPRSAAVSRAVCGRFAREVLA